MLSHPVVLSGWYFFIGTPLFGSIFGPNFLYMKRWLIMALCWALVACNQPHKAFLEKVAGADSVAINYFRGDGRQDTVVAVRLVSNQQQVQQLTTFIGGSSAELYKCGYDGSLHYFKRGAVLQDVNFRMNDAQCMHFAFVLDGRLHSTRLSAAARQLLESLKK